MNTTADSLEATVRWILLNEWDPIGIKDVLEAQDEYESYLPAICGMLRSGCSSDDLHRYLYQIESEHMGLDVDTLHTSKIAKRLTGLLTGGSSKSKELWE
jgi:hypothetical protein